MTDVSEIPSQPDQELRTQVSGRYGSVAFWHHFLVVLLVAMLGLYFGSGLLIPLAVALLSFVLLTIRLPGDCTAGRIADVVSALSTRR